MPNIDFYAAGSDFDSVLTYVFERSVCRVFESYSPFGEELVEFKSIRDVAARYPIGICIGSSPSVLLELVTPNSADLFKIRRVSLAPDSCGGHTFRDQLTGWGLIQLHLGGVGPRGLVSSHSNHNSESRARKWQRTFKELGSVDRWNWPEIARISSAFNRFIRTNLSVSNLGSRPVLAKAAIAFADGICPVMTGDKVLLETRPAPDRPN
jgi:hypothetical protein